MSPARPRPSRLAPRSPRVFLKLGLTSFGGPVAHLGYFRDAFVVRRGWLDDRAFADLVGLCQFLPGPASSQVGFAIGLTRAGYLGGLAAWAGFTLPSALAMTLFAYGASALSGRAGEGLLHGLKLVAVAIVAQAVLGMAKSLTPDKPRAAIAILAMILMALAPGSVSQLAVIVLGALAGLVLLPTGRRSARRGRQGPDFPPDGRDIPLPFLRRPGAVLRPGEGRRPRAACRRLSFRRAGLRRRPCGSAVAARRRRRSRMGFRQRVPGGLRRRAGRAGAAVHFLRLSGRGRQRAARRRFGRGAGADRDLRAGTSHRDGRAAILA